MSGPNPSRSAGARFGRPPTAPFTIALFVGFIFGAVTVVSTSDRVCPSHEQKGKTFTHQIVSDPDDGAPEFFSDDDDPVIVTFTTDELRQLGRLA